MHWLAVPFYDNLILPGTKITNSRYKADDKFYDNLILPGTKIPGFEYETEFLFYDNLILPGTKIQCSVQPP